VKSTEIPCISVPLGGGRLGGKEEKKKYLKNTFATFSSYLLMVVTKNGLRGKKKFKGGYMTKLRKCANRKRVKPAGTRGRKS